MKANKFFKQTACAAFLAVFVLGLAAPSAVFADDGTPAEQPAVPAAEEAAQSVTPPAETEPAGEEPAAEETPVIENPAAEAEALIEQTGEVMKAIPEGTELVVLDENGEPLPLGSLEAEQVMLSGDPMWCPNDVLPGGEGCTAGATSFLGGGGLLSQLAGMAGNGIIYVSYDYNTGNDNDYNNYIVFDQTQAELTSLDNLTIQGGWNFTTNQINPNQPYSVFNFGTGLFAIQNWTNDVAIKNIRFTQTTNGTAYGAYAGALAVINPDTGGDVLLQDVMVTASGKDNISGAYINTNGDVTVKNSYFNLNMWNGLVIASNGKVVINSVKAESNNGGGVYINPSNGIKIDNFTGGNNKGFGLVISEAYGDVEINTSELNGNTLGGLGIGALYDGAKLTLTSVTANANKERGFEIVSWDDFITGAVVIDRCEANDNTNEGFFIAAEDITIKNVEALGNSDGISIRSSGNVKFSGSNTFNANTHTGLYAQLYEGGRATISNVTVNNNSYQGMSVRCYWGKQYDECGKIDLSGVQAFENGAEGIDIMTNGDVLVKNSEASRNKHSGLNISPWKSRELGNVTISCSTFSSNGEHGVYIHRADQVDLWGVKASDNFYQGINVYSNSINIYERCIDGGSCNLCTEKLPALSGLVVPVAGGENVALECGYAWTMLQLNNQDAAKFSGMCGSELAASLSGLPGDSLPASLPEGMLMGAGMTAGVNGAAILPDGGSMRIIFNVPDELQGKTLSILFWDADAGEWVKLPLFGEGGFAASDAAMQVLSGVQVNADGTVTATVNFGGTFVLVGE